MIPETFLKAALTGAAFFLGGAAFAQEAPSLTLPIDCTLGQTCFIQQFVDRDPGPGAQDFTCGPLSYDTHSGTDFRLADFEDLAQGVTVLAALNGRIEGTRNNVPDTGRDGMPDGQDCGNGLRISHDDGWETQYCHLQQGSIVLAPGTQVQAGDPLGLVGYSGNSEFPHLHFTLRHNGETVDPFAPGTRSCGSTSEQAWEDPIDYQPGGLLTVGFAPYVPEFDEIREGTAHHPMIAARSAPVVLWAFLFGGQQGDQIQFVIEGPDGAIVHDHTAILERLQAELFRASGRRAPQSGGWPPGLYQGSVTYSRDGIVLGEAQIETQIP